MTPLDLLKNTIGKKKIIGNYSKEWIAVHRNKHIYL